MPDEDNNFSGLNDDVTCNPRIDNLRERRSEGLMGIIIIKHKNCVFSFSYDLESPAWFTLHDQDEPLTCVEIHLHLLYTKFREVRILRRLEILQ